MLAAHCLVDVGVWKGQSTIALAQALKDASQDGCVLAVDTCLGSAEHWSGTQHGSIGAYTRSRGMPDIFDQFMVKLSEYGPECMVEVRSNEVDLWIGAIAHGRSFNDYDCRCKRAPSTLRNTEDLGNAGGLDCSERNADQLCSRRI